MTAIAGTTDDLRARFDAAPMSRAQGIAVALTVILSALDGFDVLSVTFAAPAISREWGIGKAELGLILSSGLAGMALGSFLLAPFADVVGRRRTLLVSLVLMAVGMLLAALSTSLGQLIACRVLTGVGIGTCVVVINPLAAEFANARRRSLAVALMAIGYPIGGLVGGLLAAALLTRFGWPSIFVAGFVAALILLPVVAVLLPESIVFLLARRRGDSLSRINAVLVRCGHAPVTALPPAAPANVGGYAALFVPRQRGVTIRLAMVGLLYAVAAYYTLSWLPQMVADAGFSPSRASLVSAAASVAGIVGGISLGLAARRFGLGRLTAAMMLGLAIAMATFGYTPPVFGLLLLVGALSGLFLFSATAGLYGTIAHAFSPEARATGTGLVIGISRIGSALGPFAAGLLFAHGLGRGAVSAVFGGCALVAAILLGIERHVAGEHRTPIEKKFLD